MLTGSCRHFGYARLEWQPHWSACPEKNKKNKTQANRKNACHLSPTVTFDSCIVFSSVGTNFTRDSFCVSKSDWKGKKAAAPLHPDQQSARDGGEPSGLTNAASTGRHPPPLPATVCALLDRYMFISSCSLRQAGIFKSPTNGKPRGEREGGVCGGHNKDSLMLCRPLWLHSGEIW